MKAMQNFLLRYATFIIAGLTFFVSIAWALVMHSSWWLAIVSGCLTTVGVMDIMQTECATLRNYPILGHIQLFFEFIRPRLRQYFLDDTREAPFSRNQRSIVHERANQEPGRRPFGTQMDMYQQDHEWINHSIMPADVGPHDFRITIGAERLQPYSASVFNISAMSFGAVSANAIRALNRGARQGRFMQDTGEGGISRYHFPEQGSAGGDLVWQIGSGYFGCRDIDGSFSQEEFIKNATLPQVKMIEIKLSQGSKPGHGEVLPGVKVTLEIAAARNVKPGVDCVSPARHSAFNTPIGLLHFIDLLRTLSGGKPVGFKLAIGYPWEFFGIVKAMLQTGITPDFIVVDGSEGGSSSSPMEFNDHVGMPLQDALRLVHNTLTGTRLRDKVKIGASGKIITAFDIVRTLALGADWCNSARGFMFALGCTQALKCNTGACPTGIATQDPFRQHALVVTDKADRVTHFHQNTLKALAELIAALGLTHPSELRPSHLVRRVSANEFKLVSSLLSYLAPGDLLDEQRVVQLPEVFGTYWPVAQAESFRPAH